MDYGYTESCRYEVRIADNDNKLIGSGVLFVPGMDRFVYVFTTAHLFWYTDDSNKEYVPLEINLSLTYAVDRERVSNIRAHIRRASDGGEYDDEVILLHQKYNPKERNSRWDAAILRIRRESWIEEKIKVFNFPSVYEEVGLSGWGYPETMSETENYELGVVDSFRESLPLEGSAKKYDEKYQEILFQYFGERENLDLDGFSGTGLYAKPNLFFGVFARDAGNEYSGSYAWVTAWTAFEDILNAYGNVEYTRYIEPVGSVSLNQQAWWLPDSTSYDECGLMDDRYSINLQALLLGMTDFYTVVLASVWKGGIGRSLENQIYQYISEHAQDYSRKLRQQWFEYDEYFPKHTINIEQKYGIVINLCIDGKKPYEVRQRIVDILHQREERVKECKLIININSSDPRSAFDALYGVWETRAQRTEESIDFLSAISYSMLAEQRREVSWQEVKQVKERLERMELPEMSKELIMYRDMKTSIWWKVLEDMTESENQEEILLGFQVAKSYHPAMECWIGRLKVRWCEKWRKNPEELRCRLSLEDIDLLCWELYLYQKGCAQDTAIRWRNLLNELKDYSSESIRRLLDMLLCRNEVMHLEVTLLQPQEVVRWACTAEKEEFEQSLPSLKTNKVYYLSAIVNSIYGLKYVLNEIYDQRQSTYVGNVLNQKVSGTKDIYQKEDAAYIRSIVRRRRKG